MQEHALLLKSIVDYRIKTAEFEEMLYKVTLENVDKLTVKQLEIVIWALAKRLTSQEHKPLTEENSELERECLIQLCDVLKMRSASMKPRGVAFAVEAITSVTLSSEVLSQEKADEIFTRLERVVLT